MPRANNLVLTGFMGTGKSIVGQEVARRLGRPFVDLDTEIEARAGRSVARIFAEEGEAAFRQMERELCVELSEPQGWVIATGGGTLVDPQNRAGLLNHGTAVCLDCRGDEILRRVAQDGRERPLLRGPNPHAEVERLLAARRAAYAAVPWHIDTTALAVDEVVRRVLDLAQVVTLAVRFLGRDSLLHVGRGLLPYLGSAMQAAGTPAGSRVAVVSNPIVDALYGEPVGQALGKAGLAPFFCSIPDGEENKSLAAVASLYEQFLAGGLDRGGTVLALGGGVTGDVAGFAAATFMRGVRLVQVPTTLLAMVDASVGGKTGVDLPQGKNLVGAFKPADLVLIDPEVLATLPEIELRCGIAEVIKHGWIGAPELLDDLESGGELASWWQKQGQEWITRSLQVKIAIVEQDPLEQGVRAVLNLGHTFGHALERQSGFTLRHGEAVAIGLVAAARLAVALGRAEPALVERTEAVLAAWGLPRRCPPLAAGQVVAAMAHDKKRQGSSQNWILPRAAGQVEIAAGIAEETVLQVLVQMGAK